MMIPSQEGHGSNLGLVIVVVCENNGIFSGHIYRYRYYLVSETRAEAVEPLLQQNSTNPFILAGSTEGETLLLFDHRISPPPRSAPPQSQECSRPHQDATVSIRLP